MGKASNFKINKIEKNSRQAKKTSVSLILINNILVSDTKLSLIVIDRYRKANPKHKIR